jgi:hypothetical protein
MCECANSPAASGANNSLGRGVPVLVFANLGAEPIQLVRADVVGACCSGVESSPVIDLCLLLRRAGAAAGRSGGGD